MEQSADHPSIIAWTPLNETQVIGDDAANYREAVREIRALTKLIDPTRPVNDCSGFIHVQTDIWTVHLYRRDASELKAALETEPVFMFRPELEGSAYSGQPYVNDEFGGFLFLPPDKTSRFAANTWGYHGVEITSAADFLARIREQVEVMTAMSRCAGFCYTQLTDVEQEQNGVLTGDRVPKAPLEELRKVFSGGGR